MRHEDPAQSLSVQVDDKVGTAWWDGHLLVVGYFDMGTDDMVLPVELRAIQSDRPPTREELTAWVRAWTVPDGSPFAFTGIRDLPLGSLSSLAQREVDKIRDDEPLAALSPSEIDELAQSDERLGFRSVRDLRSNLMQVLATAAYLRAVYEGERSPTFAVAKATGTKEQRPSQLITLARRSGYLTETEPGKAGGRATDRARTLCQQANDALQRVRDSSSQTHEDEGDTQ